MRRVTNLCALAVFIFLFSLIVRTVNYTEYISHAFEGNIVSSENSTKKIFFNKNRLQELTTLHGKNPQDGVATVVRTYDNLSVAISILANLPTHTNKQYVFWLANSDFSTYIMLGALEDKNAALIGKYYTSEQYTSYNNIVVSEEIKGVDIPEIPTTVSLVGSFED